MKRTLEHVSRMLIPEGDVPTAVNWPLVRSLVGLQQPTWAKTIPDRIMSDAERDGGEDPKQVKWYSPHLNDSQKEAIDFCLRADTIACIHGPPGVSRAWRDL